jgi:plastocyanin
LRRALLFLIIFFCTLLSSATFDRGLWGQDFPPPKPKPTEDAKPKSGSSKAKDTPKLPGTLLITADLDCTLIVDGKEVGPLKADGATAVEVKLGDHLVEALSTDGKLRWKKIVGVKDTNQVVVSTQLKEALADAAAKVKSDARLESGNKANARYNESTQPAAIPTASPPIPYVPPAVPATPIDPLTAATIRGTVRLDGEAPKAAQLDMSRDPGCQGMNTAENVVANAGYLSNVFVYVKEGFGNRTFNIPKDVIILDQSGCRYAPHVLGAMVGQTIKIVNSDPTAHNIHPIPKGNQEWNLSQPPEGAPLERFFAREEIMIAVKCNIHPWMRMFVNVTRSPFFAVTGPDGKFEIKGLPPGEYTLAFVQEKLGEQDVRVTLAAKDAKTVDATFKP